MMGKYIEHNVHNKELMFYQSGEMACEPKHSYGPAIRDHYLIHFVIKGKGYYEIGDQRYELSKGQAFLICPNVITYYEADRKEPWEYMWVGFNGEMAETYLRSANIDEENVVFQFDKTRIAELLKQVNRINGVGIHKTFMAIGLLYQLLGELAHCSNKENEVVISQQSYVNEAILFIQMNFSRPITVQEIAAHLCINRSYFYTLFKNELGQSPKEYLTTYRLNKACELMTTHDLTLSQIARSVGYEDPLLFSKTFKKEYGVSPKYYRAEML